MFVPARRPVSFAIGCSFSFEEALLEDGIEVRHITLGRNVPMFRTSIQCASAGVFHGPLVVSMRPLKPADAVRAVQITLRFLGARRAGGIEVAGADRHQPTSASLIYGDAVCRLVRMNCRYSLGVRAGSPARRQSPR